MTLKEVRETNRAEIAKAAGIAYLKERYFEDRVVTGETFWSNAETAEALQDDLAMHRVYKRWGNR